jgi:hypothetical protein
MREVIARQLRLGHADIGSLTFNPRSRDDIPQVLQGLQYIYVTDERREAVFAVLEKLVPAEVDASRGRPGMDLWNALVLATLRVNLNWDYDRLLEMANQHRSIRQMLGHGFWDDDYEYKLQTVKDNADLVDEASLQRINQLVVEAGHKLLKKSRAAERPL